MQQQKRINVFNKDTGMLMRVTHNRALTLMNEGYAPTSKGRLKCFLNRQRKLQKNEKTLKRLGINIDIPSKDHNYYKLPSGKIHIRVPQKSMTSMMITGYRHLITRFTE